MTFILYTLYYGILTIPRRGPAGAVGTPCRYFIKCKVKISISAVETPSGTAQLEGARFLERLSKPSG